MARSMILLLAFGAIGCGEVAYAGQNTEQSAQAECAPSTGGEQGTPDELSELLAEVLAPRMCEQVIGSFIGLPGEETREGAQAGLDPAAGRWWIRQCQASATEGRLRVAFGGSGWTWLDRETMGFRVRQYLRFDANATFAASLHVGYDRRSRVATVWLRPAPDVTATVRPQGLVRAEATGVFSSVLGGILDMTGSSASDRARAQAAEEGSQRLRDRLSTGFTVTFDLDTEQMDFMLGELTRGEVPVRPWTDTQGAWIVNERSSVWPAGMDVLGPIGADAGAVTLDVELEEGPGATLRRVCADDLGRWLDAAWNGRTSSAPPGQSVVELRSAHAPRTVALEPLACRSLLLVQPPAQATIPSTLRYRVRPSVPTATSPQHAANVQPSASSGTTPQPSAATFRVEVRSASIVTQTPSGNSWDVVGGEPDVYVVVHSIPQRRELDRTPVVSDSREARFNRTLSGSLRAAEFPIRFLVYDEDVTNDEAIGTAEVDPSALRATAVDLALELRSEGQNPAPTGTLRIRLTPVQ